MNEACFIQWSDKIGLPHVVKFNAVTNQTHEGTSEVTEKAVEKGADVADHIRQNGDRVSFECMVSNEPLFAEDNFGGNENFGIEQAPSLLDVPSYEPPLQPTPGSLFHAAGSAIRNVLFGKPEYVARVLQFAVPFDAVLAVHEKLITLKEDGEVLTVYTSTRTYEDMVLTGVVLNKTPSEGTGAKFSLEFKKVRFVESLLVDAPVPTELRATPPKKKSTQGKEITDPVKKQSMLKKMGL
jgi:hypothetical protein